MKYTPLFLFLLTLNVSFAQKVISNKKYRYTQIETVSFTPFFDQNGNLNNQMNSMIEEALESSFDLCCQPQIVENLLNLESLNQIADDLIYGDISQRIKKKTNLFQDLNEEDKVEVQRGFDNTDLLIIISNIGSRTITKLNKNGTIIISGNVSAFDLRTGELIAHVSDEIKSKYDVVTDGKAPVEELITSLFNELLSTLEK